MKNKRSTSNAQISRAKRAGSRRRPRQPRAHLTLTAIMDAVVRILKKNGVAAVNTNRIAAVAGVSIGSVYQYFPDKHAIFVALHQRHIEDIDRRIEHVLLERAAAPLRELIRALLEAMIEAHTADPELYELLHAEVPHRAGGTQDFPSRLHRALRLAMGSRVHELAAHADLNLTVFVVAHMVDALAHGAVLRRPAGVSLSDAKQEAVRAILAYLQSGD